jgi:hypothetical protein
LGGIGGLGGFNMYGAYLPQAQGIAGGLISDPNAGGFMQGAQTAAGLGQAGAMNQFGAGGGLYGLGGTIANTAFDPQSALYSRTAQQLQDQTRAAQGARGIATTPFGAGLESQAMSDFNINWQNQQLQRQLAGGQAAGQLYGQGAALQAGAPGQYLTASGMPYATSQGIGQAQLGTLGALGQFGAAGGQQAQQPISDYMNYLQWATGQAGQSNADQLRAYQAQLGGQQGYFNQQMAQTGQQFNEWQALNNLQNQQFQNQLAQDKQAFGEQGSMFGGIGKLASWAFPNPGSIGSAFKSPSSYFGF